MPAGLDGQLGVALRGSDSPSVCRRFIAPDPLDITGAAAPIASATGEVLLRSGEGKAGRTRGDREGRR